MSHNGMFHGGLVFAGKQENALDQVSRIVSATLQDYGHMIERQDVLSKHQACVTASRYMVKITLNEGVNPSETDIHQRLELTLCAANPSGSDTTQSELILVVMLYRMIEIYQIESVEWLDPKTILTTEEFLGAFSTASPQRVHSRQQILDTRNSRFAPVHETEPGLAVHYDVIAGQCPYSSLEGLVPLGHDQALSLAFHDTPHPAEYTPSIAPTGINFRRFTSRGISEMRGHFSTSVAASMAVINRLRGEDARHNTLVLSLNGFLVMLVTSSAVAGITSFLPH